MKKNTLLSLITVFLIGCGSDKRENFTTLNEDGDIVISEESTAILEAIQADYDACKSNESEERECNRFTAEALCRFYQIDDFKKILSKQMKGRLEKLDRDVQFLRLELDKLNSKKDQTAIEKEKIVDLESKINTRRKTFFKS